MKEIRGIGGNVIWVLTEDELFKEPEEAGPDTPPDEEDEDELPWDIV